MAEFTEVMRQALRMCDEIADCDQCPLMDTNGCRIDPATRNHHYDEAERIVMEWVEENPEPRYPTWIEWQKKNFPKATVTICAATFGDEFKMCDESDCDACLNRPIPAHIAELLNIKPEE